MGHENVQGSSAEGDDEEFYDTDEEIEKIPWDNPLDDDKEVEKIPEDEDFEDGDEDDD